LQQAIVPVWNQSKCRNAYSKFGIHITENQLCAGYDNGGTDACQVGIFSIFLMDRCDHGRQFYPKSTDFKLVGKSKFSNQ
jgi:Trypsin